MKKEKTSRRICVGDFRIEDEERRAINDVLDNGRISEWKRVSEFEKLFAEYIGVKFSIAVSSGTSAILAGLYALLLDERYVNVKKGSKVITSPVTYVATVNAIVLAGFEPVFVDIDPYTFDLIPDAIENILKDGAVGDYSIILPVHLMGYPNNMKKINEIANKYGLIVFEDSAQAHGTLIDGKRTGSFSILSDFSFYIAHNIQAGEMGALTTDDERLWKLLKKIKSNGRRCDCQICIRPNGKCPRKDEEDDPRFIHEYIGYNFKAMEFQAALAIVQLKKADWIFNKRSQNVRYLNEKLATFGDMLQLPRYSEDVSYLAYPIIIKNNMLPRKKLMSFLESYGIETRPLFGCIPTQQPAFSYLREHYKDKLYNAERIGNNGFYIGCHQYLTTDDLDYIVKIFYNFMANIYG